MNTKTAIRSPFLVAAAFSATVRNRVIGSVPSQLPRNLLLLLVAGLTVACMSPHQKRIHDARHDGNEGRAYCFETCDPNDEECHSNCRTEFPNKWHQKYTKTARPFLVAGKRFNESLATVMHPYAIGQARQGGNEPLATCYESCKPVDSRCMRTCDNTHATEEEKQARSELYAEITKVGIESYKKDKEEARKRETDWANSNGPSNNGSVATPDPRPSRPSPTTKPKGKSCGSSVCSESQKCVTLLEGTTQCAAGGRCWKVKETEQVCKAK